MIAARQRIEDVTMTDTAATASNRAMMWTGYALSGIVIAFMAFDIVIKLLALPIVLETSAGLGITGGADMARLLGVILLVCTLLYAYPRTALLGAVLLAAYLGGAVATHVRVGSPLFTHILFGVYLGVFTWGGLWLRDARLRALFPWRGFQSTSFRWVKTLLVRTFPWDGR
jgi:DoxX-like family